MITIFLSMKKIVLYTLLLIFIFSIGAALLIPAQPNLTWIIFTIIDVTILCIFYLSYRHEKKKKEIERTASLIDASERDEILFICKETTKQHREELADQLREQISSGDPKMVEAWSHNQIPAFVRQTVVPAIEQSVPGTSYKKIMMLGDEMNILVFKITVDTLSKNEIPDNLLKQFNF